MSLRKRIAGVAVGTVMALSVPTAAMAQDTTQDGLVNVSIGDVTVIEDVDIAVAARIVANVCAQVDVENVNILNVLTAIDQDATGETTFTCDLRGGSGDTVAVTQN